MRTTPSNTLHYATEFLFRSESIKALREKALKEEVGQTLLTRIRLVWNGVWARFGLSLSNNNILNEVRNCQI